MAAPIDFRMETTRGIVRSLSEFQGKAILLAIESMQARGQNDALHAHLNEQAQNSAGLLERLALVPVASLGEVGDSAIGRATAKAVVSGAANAKGLELWLDWKDEALRLVYAPKNMSTVVVVGPDLVPKWKWSGPCPREQWSELLNVLRAQAQ